MIDSHCHLADDIFQPDLDAVAARAKAAGVTSAVCILSADEQQELDRVEQVRGAWPAVHFAAGIHPHRAGAYAGRTQEAAEATRRAVAHAGAVAIGEIGLDYHYDFAPRDVQRAVFEAQLGAAIDAGLPVIIHTREATEDTLAVLRGAGPALRGVMHCFSGSMDEARRALDLGFLLSFAGIITFNKADALREVARSVPADRVLIETDAPFLAPVPHRGKRNEPAWVAATLARLSALQGRDPADVEAALDANFTRLFR